MLLSVTDIIHKSIELYRQHWKLFLQFVLIIFVPITLFYTALDIGAGSQMRNGSVSPLLAGVIILASIVTGLLSLLFSLAFIRIVAKAYKNQPILPLREEIRLSLPLMLPAVIVTAVGGIAILGGLILFIVPGIIVALWFSFSIYTVALDEKKGIEALKESKQLVQGRWWAILWRLAAPAIIFSVVSYIPQQLIQFIFTSLGNGFQSSVVSYTGLFLASLIGVLFAPLTSAAQTILYLDAKEHPTTPAT